jgi:replicative DNA helicase
MANNIEQKIITNLIFNETYLRKVAPFIECDYFSDKIERTTIQVIMKFFADYNKPITPDILKIEISNRNDVTDVELAESLVLIDQYKQPEEINEHWLLDNTEKFCKDRSVYNAILKSIKIIEGKDKNVSQDAIPKILQDALSICFDSHVGHNYIDNADDRYDYYHRQEEKIRFDLEMMDKITAGGISKKSLTIILAPTGAGKSLVMCHMAANTLMQGKNVLYITMEMAEEKIAERIDANIMNLTMDEMKVVDKSIFDSKINQIKQKTKGKLIVKEYPTAGAHSGHFRALIEELKIKKEFIPDIIFVDYLNICASARLKMSGSINSYLFIKSIAEELRGLGVEYNIPMVSATQTSRSGYNNSELELNDVSECIEVNQEIQLYNGSVIKIGDVHIGQSITSNDIYKTVVKVHHKKIKPCVKITLKSGRQIVVSRDHTFPSSFGGEIKRRSISDGLKEGCFLHAL